MVAHLRTFSVLFAAVLSEDNWSSDIFTSFCCGFVRRSLVFGHFHFFLLWFCPKIAGLRTLSLLFAAVLSEDRWSSDTFTSFCCGFVRRSLVFGHFHFSLLLFCPKIAGLRTLSLLFAEVLSEVASFPSQICSSISNFLVTTTILSRCPPYSSKKLGFPTSSKCLFHLNIFLKISKDGS
jgi:hypothetical protein